MKIKLFVLFIVFSVSVESQEMTVFYKEKRVPAQVSMKESVDYSEVDLFYNREVAKINAAQKRGLSRDSVNILMNILFGKRASLEKRITKKAKENKPKVIPSYDYITILKTDAQKSLYYPQKLVENDTIINQALDEKGNVYTSGRINYNNSEIIYMNQSQKKKISSLEVYQFDLKGRKFLIEEALEDQDWMLTKETKKIDQYLCYKAVLNNSEKRVEVWYTREIKAAHGPKGYYGLPGLILELKEGKKNVSFHKIHLLSKEKTNIKPPTEGEKITREDLENLPAKLFGQH